MKTHQKHMKAATNNLERPWVKEMFCGNCGKELREGVKFCPNCGTKVEVDYASGNEGMERAKAFGGSLQVKENGKPGGNPKALPLILVVILAGVATLVIVLLIKSRIDYKKIYGQVFSDLAQEATKEDYDNFKYALFDVNGDGLMELIVQYDEKMGDPDMMGGPMTRMYAVEDGRASRIGDNFTEFLYDMVPYSIDGSLLFCEATGEFYFATYEEGKLALSMDLDLEDAAEDVGDIEKACKDMGYGEVKEIVMTEGLDDLSGLESKGLFGIFR